MIGRKRYLPLLVGPPLAFLAVFYFFPLAEIFGYSFRPGGRWSLAAVSKLVGSSYYLGVLWFTLWQAAVSTLLTVALALPGAYILARYRFRGKKLLLSLTTVPFVLPTVVVAAAFRAFLGSNGLVNDFLSGVFGLSRPPIRLDQSIWMILLAHVFYNYTIVLRLVGGYWMNLGPRLAEAARMLGASPWVAFRQVTWPLLRPAVLAAALLVFIFCFTSFGVILILGGPGFATIEVEIYRQAIHLFNLPMAAALSVIQIGFTFGLMWLYTSLQRRSALPLHLTAASRNERPLANRRDKIIVWGAAGFMVALLIVPLLALAASSFQGPDGWTLTFYAALFENPAQSVFYVPPIRAALNSLLFAGFAAALAMVIGLSAAAYLAAPHGKMTSILDPVFMLPLSTSAVTLGFGFILALDRPPLNLRTSLALVPLAHTLVAFPFVVRSILPVMRGIPRGLREAAQVLGASPPRVWRTVDLPIITRGLLVGAVFAFAISMGEFGATAFTARPETPTMPLAVYRFLSRPGTMNYGQAMAMSTLLMAVTAAAFAALERLGGPREF